MMTIIDFTFPGSSAVEQLAVNNFVLIQINYAASTSNCG